MFPAAEKITEKSSHFGESGQVIVIQFRSLRTVIQSGLLNGIQINIQSVLLTFSPN
jgi:hypothetical protein